MSNLQIARRYAKALMGVAEEHGVLEPVRQSIEYLVNIGSENPQFLAVLKNPIITYGKKLDILNAIFKGSVHQLVFSFFKIIANKGRSTILHAIAKEFMHEYHQRKGIIKARLTSATKLSDGAKKQIIQAIHPGSVEKVFLEEIINTQLLGGFILKVGDKQYDASIAKKLKNLKKELSS